MNSTITTSAAEKALKKKLGTVDIVYHKSTILRSFALFVFADSMTDKEVLSKTLLPALNKVKTKDPVKLSQKLPFASISVIFSINDAVNEVLEGKTVAFFDGESAALSIDLKKIETRAVAEPPTGTFSGDGYTLNSVSSTPPSGYSFPL